MNLVFVVDDFSVRRDFCRSVCVVEIIRQMRHVVAKPVIFGKFIISGKFLISGKTISSGESVISGKSVIFGEFVAMNDVESGCRFQVFGIEIRRKPESGVGVGIVERREIVGADFAAEEKEDICM